MARLKGDPVKMTPKKHKALKQLVKSGILYEESPNYYGFKDQKKDQK